MKDGHLKQCRDCKKVADSEWRRRNRAQKAETDRRWREKNRERRAEAWARWQKENPDLVVASSKRYKGQHPEKAAAVRTLGNAVRDGKIIKPTQCQDCRGNFPKRLIHGHHEDYSKPLEVVWVCPNCHKARHAEGRR